MIQYTCVCVCVCVRHKDADVLYAAGRCQCYRRINTTRHGLVNMRVKGKGVRVRDRYGIRERLCWHPPVIRRVLEPFGEVRARHDPKGRWWWWPWTRRKLGETVGENSINGLRERSDKGVGRLVVVGARSRYGSFQEQTRYSCGVRERGRIFVVKT